MRDLDRAVLRKFVNRAAKVLQGKWVLLGGALIPFLSRAIRRTADIDLIGFGVLERGQTLELMELAQSLQLPPESINQAAMLYLKKIPDWKDQLILIHESDRASIYRPNLTLYILLKLQRLSEGDLKDCLEYLSFSKKNGEAVDQQRLIKEIEKQINKVGKSSEGKKDRLRILKRSVA